MKKVLIVLVLFAGLVVGGFFVAASMGPEAIDVSESVQINAVPAAVLPHVHDLKNWEKWTKWTTGENAVKVEYGEKTAGEGARWEWDDNGTACWMEFTRADESGIAYDLQFGDMPMSNGVVEVKADEANLTTVTWTMNSDISDEKMARVMGIFLDMDELIGADFSEGLAQLKTLVESPDSGTELTTPKTEDASKSNG